MKPSGFEMGGIPTFNNIVIEHRQMKSIKKEIHVKQDYMTIQEAINAAEENTLIKIDEGLYKENLVIRKPNIFLEPKKSSEVYLVGENGPTILIDFPQEGGNTVNIQGFKISNKGIRRVVPQSDGNSFGYNPSDFKDLLKYAAESEKGPEAECLVYVKSGMLSIYNCHFSCNLFFKTSSKFVSCIYAAPKTQCLVNECHFKGSSSCLTNGITSFEANVSIRYSDFRSFLGSAVLFNMVLKNISSLCLCKISECRIGVCLLRENARTKVSDCQIMKCEVGALVGCGSEVLVTKSQFTKNQTGIRVVAADPQIVDNTIAYNSQHGVSILSDDLLTIARLVQNQIHDNEKCGVKISGDKNQSQLSQNRIFLNRRAGVFTKARTHAMLTKNDIFKNLAQGICVQESSSVFAESNLVRENIKANIAIGSKSERETILLRNIISDGRCEGVFLMEAIMTRIFYNTITNNHFGIMCVNSSPTIIGNQVSSNMAHGILCLKKSAMIIGHNRIFGNQNVGLYIRDVCRGSIENNQLNDNRIEVIIERRCPEFHDLLEPDKGNRIVGDIRIPTNQISQIF